MHIASGSSRAGAAGGSRRGVIRRGSSGNLSLDGDGEQPSPQASPGSVGGRSSTAMESHFRRIQHVFSVFFGRVSATHTDFLAKRGLLTRLLLSIAESVTVVFALTVIGTVIFSSLERTAVRFDAPGAAPARDLHLTRGLRRTMHLRAATRR